MKLVQMHQERIVVSSLEVAKNFDKAHNKLLRDIRELNCSEEFKVSNFGQSTYTNRGKEYPCYLMTRDGFSFLVMGFTGKEAAQWKEKYIKAFNDMEKLLLKQQDKLEWKLARTQSILGRKSLTDTIQRFVEYAEAQGATKAKYYYSNITKMEYKALGLLELYCPKFRDQLSQVDINFLITAENICMLAIQEGINKNLNYKDIYQLAKNRVNEYALVVNKFKPSLSIAN